MATREEIDELVIESWRNVLRAKERLTEAERRYSIFKDIQARYPKQGENAEAETP